MTIQFEELTSFIGTELGDPTSPFAEKAPSSAKHVVTIAWSWSPMHSRTSKYRLATDRKRQTWSLYEISPDPLGCKENVCARVATGTPYRGVTAARAAYLLLQAVWLSEVELWDFDPVGFEVIEPGLLIEHDIGAIVYDIKWVSQSAWLKEQSSQSMAALRVQLPDIPDDQSIETLDEIGDCVHDLSLTQDFLELCKYYELQHPNIHSLASLVVKDATFRREQKVRNSEINVEKYREQIFLLTSNLSQISGRAGGMSLPSMQERVRYFLKIYVGEHGSLPSGIHEIMGGLFDFDDLRGKYSL